MARQSMKDRWVEQLELATTAIGQAAITGQMGEMNRYRRLAAIRKVAEAIKHLQQANDALRNIRIRKNSPVNLPENP